MSNNKRDDKILDKWNNTNLTMAEIGDSFKPKMTRQSVYAVLKRMGYDPNTRKDTAKQKRDQLAMARVQRQHNRDVIRYGVTTEEIDVISIEAAKQLKIKGVDILPRSHPQHPLSLYRTWEKNAKPIGNKGVNFAVWWKMWQDSGHWADRGNGEGYWMARIDTRLPFAPDNIIIQTGRDVSTETQRRIRVRKKKDSNARLH
jgi:hypothetical protein